MKSAVTLWKWPTHPNRKHFLKTRRAFKTLQLKGVSNSLRPRANQRIFKPRRGKCNEQDVAEDIRFSHLPLKFTYSLCHKPDMSKGAVIVLYESNILIKKKEKVIHHNCILSLFVFIATCRNIAVASPLMRWISPQFGSQLPLIFPFYHNHSLWPQLWFALEGLFKETSVSITLCLTASVHLCQYSRHNIFFNGRGGVVLQCLSKARGQKHATNSDVLIMRRICSHCSTAILVMASTSHQFVFLVLFFFAILSFFNCVLVIFDHVSCKLLGWSR